METRFNIFLQLSVRFFLDINENDKIKNIKSGHNNEIIKNRYKKIKRKEDCCIFVAVLNDWIDDDGTH